jgi:hypothetical protein
MPKFRYDPEVGVYEVGQEMAGLSCFGSNSWATGVTSQAAGCHSSQVEEFREDARRAGITGVDFKPDGAAVFSSRGARKRYLQFRGLCDRDAGYGDAMPTNY